MNERIRALREQSLQARPCLSLERALLLTEFEQSDVAGQVSTPMRRALGFRHLMEHKRLHIGEGELIVGERGPEPKATPTYPELCAHSLEDLDILNRREKIPFHVSDADRATHADRLLPYWKGRSMRDRIMAAMSPQWRDAYAAGVFTEFQEQRAPGHTVLGDVIYRKGMRDLQADIARAIAALDLHGDLRAYDKGEQLRAMAEAAEGLICFARRHSEALDALARDEADPVRRDELGAMAAICAHVPAHAPRTFWEALQYYWFVHLGVITELNTWDSFNPGRLDQHLLPFYQRDIAEGRLTPERARELLQAFWIKFNNHPAPPKVGVTARESGTYTDFCLINLGGVTPEGEDGVNELTYLLLDVIEEMRLLQPSSMIQVSRRNPDRFIRRALRIIRTGFGQPSVFNTDAIVQELLRQGKSLEDARRGGASGCVESGAFGRECYILTGYFNLPKMVELALHNGRDPRTDKQIGPQTGRPADFADFDAFFRAFQAQTRHFIDIKIAGNNIIDRIFARHMPAPFLSLLIEDCVENGRDYNAGGARYNTSYIQGVGLGSVTDALTAVQQNVYEKKTCSMEQLVKALDRDFEGFDDLRTQLWEQTPKYGNDDDQADAVMRRVFETFFQAVDGRPNTRGGRHHINLLPTTSHVYFGSVIGALPDGRRAGVPLSEGISPVQGADRHGPTAVIRSAAKIDHIRTGGTLLNQKFTPELLRSDAELEKLVHLIRAYFRMDGHHIQFNVVSADTLRRAQRDPDQYRSLIVRVAGYSDYFVDLGADLQDEIIHRTEHQTV